MYEFILEYLRNIRQIRPSTAVTTRKIPAKINISQLDKAEKERKKMLIIQLKIYVECFSKFREQKLRSNPIDKRSYIYCKIYINCKEIPVEK